MDISEKIEAISDYIETLNVFTEWGGWCKHYENKQPPYGIGITGSCKGNIYGYNSNEISGYIRFLDIISAPINGIKNRNMVRLEVWMFTPHKKIGQTNNTYQVPLYVQGQLSKHFNARHTFTFTSRSVQEYPDYEIAIIGIEFEHFGQCAAPLVLQDEIC